MNNDPERQTLNATERDHLQRIERVLSEGWGDDADVRSLERFALLLSNAAPLPEQQMATRIEKRLLDAFQADKESRTLEATGSHLPAPTSPGLFSRLFGGTAVRLVAFALLALALATALSSPLRATAQAWMGRIANVLITNEQTQAEQAFGQVEQLEMVRPGLPAEAADLAQITAQLDFTLLAPAYLPEDVSYATASLVETEAGLSEGVILLYAGAYPLTIEQTPYAAGQFEELAVGDEVVPAPMLVKGRPAYWLENVPERLGGVLNDETIVANPALYYYSTLIWEEGGILYRISGMGTRRPISRLDAAADNAIQEQAGLTLDNALRIAESMAPYQD